MSELTIHAGSSATAGATQELLNALAAAPPELAERLGPQLKRIVELAGRFFAARPDAEGHVSV